MQAAQAQRDPLPGIAIARYKDSTNGTFQTKGLCAQAP